MSTLKEFISEQPTAFQRRFPQDAKWLSWINDLLEELSGEGIMPLMDYERGFEVKDLVWITKPTGLRRIKKIFHPETTDLRLRWELVEGKIKLADIEIDEYTDAPAITAFSAYATDSITANLTDKEEDEYENYLLTIDTGTSAGNTYVLSGNDASGLSTTKLLFLHALTTALDAAKAITGRLIDPDYYVMMQYTGSYEAMTSIDSEVPIDGDYARRLVRTWLRWRAEANSTRTPDAALAFKVEFDDVVKKVKAEIKSSTGGPIAGRSLAGMSRGSYGRYW
jgi:hypothetical protein